MGLDALAFACKMESHDTESCFLAKMSYGPYARPGTAYSLGSPLCIPRQLPRPRPRMHTQALTPSPQLISVKSCLLQVHVLLLGPQMFQTPQATMTLWCTQVFHVPQTLHGFQNPQHQPPHQLHCQDRQGLQRITRNKLLLG